MEKVKAVFIAIVSTLMNWLGVLAIPVFLLVGCNVTDYITGVLASPFREEKISSYKGIRGIVKKVCMWFLVLVGAAMDILINYAVHTAGIELTIPFVVATVVTVWLITNELISILENIDDIGVQIPPFLMPVMKYIKRKTEEKATIAGEETDYE